MAIRSIFVPLDFEEAAASTLETALIVGKGLEAHIDVLFVRYDTGKIEPHERDFFSAETFDKLAKSVEMAGEKRAKRVRDVCTDLCRRYGVPVVGGDPPLGAASATWGEETGQPEDVTARRGRLADLIVMGRTAAGSHRVSVRSLNAALFDTGRPVLVTPPAPPSSVGTRVAIAWNGRSEAARAVGAALPFLYQAEKVMILTTETDRTPASVAPELADYLAKHGVSADTWIFARRGDTPVGEALLKECQALDADLLVIGAFGRSRVRELILGGVTRHVLAGSAVPLLMAQ